MQAFEWVHVIPGLKDFRVPGVEGLPVHVLHSFLVFALLTLLILAAGARLRRADLDIVPAPRFSLLNFFEIAYETIAKLCDDILGHHGPRFVYLIGALALWILFSNLVGVVPGLVPPTDNVNTNAACAIVVFLATHFYGFKAHGIKYLKHFAGPTPWLAPLMIPIEIIGHLARPLSLTLRLFGNMFGDHMNLMVFVFMMTGLTKAILAGPVPLWIFAPIAPLIPIIIILLGIFVAVVQAYVFILLSMSYISGAIAESH
jgi:F-type H+-transporting ATPase subunit a